jgi:hypothetical protein
MFSERQVYILYNVGSSSRILFPKVFGQCRKERTMAKTDRQRFKGLGKRWRGRREKLSVGIEKRKCRKDDREH